MVSLLIIVSFIPNSMVYCCCAIPVGVGQSSNGTLSIFTIKLSIMVKDSIVVSNTVLRLPRMILLTMHIKTNMAICGVFLR